MRQDRIKKKKKEYSTGLNRLLALAFEMNKRRL